MQDILIVVDMQNDFIDGALGSPHATAILPKVKEKIKSFRGEIIFTRDTHGSDYLQTREGRYLPIPHCIKDTDGWQIHRELADLLTDRIVDKPTFGSMALVTELMQTNEETPIKSITLIGLCTDICIISNAMLLKAALPEVNILIDASCCAGVTTESHDTALRAMEACQILVVREEDSL